ncbi:Receptor-like protein 14 [Citrus sinensis]|nr:Receptor-like protein 14 [Citrus sinensis]
MKRFLIKLSLWIGLALIPIHGCKACLETERTALLEIKSFFISISDFGYEDRILPSWVDHDDGLPSDCCDDWEGVKCNATTGRVMDLSLGFTRIHYHFNQYDGAVSLLNLSLFRPFDELQSLDVSFNDFKGFYENKAHHGFGILKQLKVLNLRYNYFNDSILPYLNKLTSLTTLYLRQNSIEGSNPKEGLANLTKLEVLDLSANEISESITGLELAKFRNLKALALSYNKINGSLESQGVCELKNLIELELSGNNLEGHLPPCLNYLTRLKVLDISSNKLRGSLPSVITNFTSLEYLDLSNNNFEGIFTLSSLANHSKLEVLVLSPGNKKLQVNTENCLATFQLKVLQLPNCNLNVIPSFLVHQYHLKYLDLSHNKMVGNFPTWLLQNNPGLEILYLANNSFTGNLQLPRAKHDFLRHLDISSNNFTSILPKNMGIVLQKLTYLDMSKNIFEGDIPYSIGEMKQLRLLYLSRNNLSGELPATLLTGCVSLESLELSNNNFHGQILPKFTNLTQLNWLYLDNNHFSGKIEDGLLSSYPLEVLDISNNMLSGHIPSWIGNFPALAVLIMSKNRLEGNIPPELSKFGGPLILDVSENCLSGYMPSSLNLSSLKHLYLRKNGFNGPIPNALFRSSELLTLDLTDNHFSGRIPHQINTLPNLRVLLLRGNYLQGPIPNQLCELQKLGIMDLSHNRFNGSIPSCLTNVSFWSLGKNDLYGIELNLEWDLGEGAAGTYDNSNLELYLSNGAHGPPGQHVEVEFVTKNRNEFYNGSNLDYMSGLDLSCNELTGGIPMEIGELQNVRSLNLSHNYLSGSIPESFFNLKMIESLDLSYNRLRGRVSPRLTELNFLSNFNVSYNNLSGLVPDKGQFATFDESNYRGNIHICGPIINKSCNSAEEILATTSNHEGDEDESDIDMVSFNWSFAASYVTFILGLLAILWINSCWRRLWFYYVDACIDSCYYWLFKHVFNR